MYYLGFLKENTTDVVIFKSVKKPQRGEYTYFTKVMGPYSTEQKARRGLQTLKQAYGEYGYRENPATSERQRKFMCAELGRLRVKKKTRTGMKEGQLRDFCKKNPGEGYYVMKWGGGRYTSVAWYASRVDAQREVDRIVLVGAWSGKVPYVEDARRKRNPARVISHGQALKLTKKILAYAKQLFRHEQAGVKGNPGKSYHDQKFLIYMRDLEKYVIGSAPYIATLAKAYEHLESAKDSVEEYVR